MSDFAFDKKPMEKEREGGELELYLHIPFCVKKCDYCDFLSAPADEKVREEYTDALCREMAGRAAEAAGRAVTSVFVGGGTPSLMRPEQIARLFETLREHYRVRPDAEITLEANPGTLDREKLQSCLAAGVNRLSIGLQSARDEELKALGRIHDHRQFLDSYRLAREAGFENINVDLMSALPGQTAESYRQSLRSVLALTPRPEHISAYSLIVEEGTPFYERYGRGELALPEEEEEREMYRLTGEMLEQAGYEHYEISNYAAKGFACRHNIGYWERREYLGLGIGAASLMGDRRFSNGRELRRYLEDPLGCRGEEEILDVRAQMEETMFLGLRLMRGVSQEKFRAVFGCEMESVYREPLEKNIRDGLLRREDGRVFLTQRGIDVSNYVMAQFLF